MFGKWTSLLWLARQRIALTWRLLRDARVPRWQKVIPFLPLLYIFSPLNLLTLPIPIIGQFDDITLVVMAMELFERVVDDRIVAEYKDR